MHRPIHRSIGHWDTPATMSGRYCLTWKLQGLVVEQVVAVVTGLPEASTSRATILAGPPGGARGRDVVVGRADVGVEGEA